MTNSKSSNRTARALWWIALAVLTLCGLLAILIAVLPYPFLKSLTDLLSKDHNLQSFTLSRYNRVKFPLALLGTLAWIIALAWAILHKRTYALFTASLHWLSAELKATWYDAKQLFRSFKQLRLEKGYLLVLLCLFILTILIRGEQLNGPVYHDEAFTFMEYASHSFTTVMTDYSLPNNHVFHTILVRVAYLLLGNYPWTIRLPAFIAGVLIIPAMFLLGWILYNKKVGLLAATLGVFMQQLIDYATSARGYSLVTLFTVLIFGLGIYLSRHKNRAGWLLLAVFSALGFYTIPTFLYPFGILFTWFLFTAFTQPSRVAYGSIFSFFKYAMLTGLLSIGLTMLFYTPIFAISGIASVFGNHVIQSNGVGNFFTNLPVTLSQIWEAWLTGLPWFGPIIITGFALSLIFHWKVSRTRIPLQIAAVLFPAAALLIQRPDSAPRVWSFLLPLLLIWTAAGILALFDFIQERLHTHLDLSAGIVALGIACSIFISAKAIIHFLPQFEHPHTQTEDVALYLKKQVKKGDVIAVTYPFDMSVIYYLSYHGVPKLYTKDIAAQDFTGLFVVVYPNNQQTIDNVLTNTGIAVKKVDTAGCQFQANVGDAFIYHCLPAK